MTEYKRLTRKTYYQQNKKYETFDESYRRLLYSNIYNIKSPNKLMSIISQKEPFEKNVPERYKQKLELYKDALSINDDQKFRQAIIDITKQGANEWKEGIADLKINNTSIFENKEFLEMKPLALHLWDKILNSTGGRSAILAAEG